MATPKKSNRLKLQAAAYVPGTLDDCAADIASKTECPACGAVDYDGELRTCPYCDDLKCSECDMGDDVGCPVCDNED